MRRTLTMLTVGVAGALVAALVVVAVPAEGAPSGGGPGDPLLLSRVNQAGPMTVLKSNGGLRILAKSPKRPPLMVYTPDSMPPLDVSSTAKVEHLNVDLLDGLDSTAFVKASQMVMPIAAYAGGDQYTSVTSAAKVIRSVTLTPPAPGTVIVNSLVTVNENTAGDWVFCSITDGTSIDMRYIQQRNSPGTFGFMSPIAGTRGFTVAGGAPFTANLVCRHEGTSGSSGIEDSSLTAIFIPSP